MKLQTARHMAVRTGMLESCSASMKAVATEASEKVSLTRASGSLPITWKQRAAASRTAEFVCRRHLANAVIVADEHTAAQARSACGGGWHTSLPASGRGQSTQKQRSASCRGPAATAELWSGTSTDMASSFGSCASASASELLTCATAEQPCSKVQAAQEPYHQAHMDSAPATAARNGRSC
jgi:hypothetical protein